FSFVDALHIRNVADGRQAIKTWQHVFVASHHGDCSKFEALRLMHNGYPRADLLMSTQSRHLGRFASSDELGFTADEQAYVRWEYTCCSAVAEPIGDTFALFLLIFGQHHFWTRAIEDRDGAATTLFDSVEVHDGWRQEPVGHRSNLMGGAVIDLQRMAAATN